MESDVFSKQRWLILLGVLGMNVACAQVQEPQSTAHQGQTVQGQEVQLQCPTNIRIGQTVTVQLESNPSTGYRWILVPPSEALQVSETEAVAIYHDALRPGLDIVVRGGDGLRDGAVVKIVGKVP